MSRALGRGSAWTVCLLGALAAGAVFRLIWVGDMEYKRDEAWVFSLTRDAVLHGQPTAVGMPSSQELCIPGLSLWVFYPLGYLFGLEDPTGLARGVQVCSLLSMMALVIFAWRCMPMPEREWWLWGAALVAVNPLIVPFQRKIWPPSMLPIFLVAALIGQIHVAGFFLAATLWLWTLAFDPARRRVAWLWWLAGSALGTAPMLPWLHYLATTTTQAHSNVLQWSRLVEGKFYSHWLTEPLGLGIQYNLGDDYAEFLRGPVLAGRP